MTVCVPDVTGNGFRDPTCAYIRMNLYSYVISHSLFLSPSFSTIQTCTIPHSLYPFLSLVYMQFTILVSITHLSFYLTDVPILAPHLRSYPSNLAQHNLPISSYTSHPYHLPVSRVLSLTPPRPITSLS